MPARPHMLLIGLAMALGNASPALPDPPDTVLNPAATREARVQSIARRILAANAAACPVQVNDFGLSVAPPTGSSWGARIETVWPDGPAAAAGLRAGDLVRTVNAVPWSADSRERTRFAEALGAMPQAHELALELERDGTRRTVVLTPRPVCQAAVRLTPSPAIRAAAFATTIELTSGLERLLRSDAELAFAIAHEAAHIALGHTAHEQRAAIGLRDRRIALERDADATALWMMAAAGYDPAAAVSAWPKIADASRPPLLRLLDVHGPYLNTRDRLDFLTREAARIAAGARASAARHVR